MTTGKYSLHGFVWNNSSLLCAFPDARNYALGPPNPKGDLWFSLESTPQQCPRNQSDNIYIYICIYKKREGHFQRKKKEIGLPAFRPTEKSRSSLPDWRSQLTDDTEEYFKPLLKKRRRNFEKKQSPTNSYTPFSTLTLIVPSILRNFQRTRTIPQTWHAPELIPVPGMWRRERDTFTGLRFFLSSKFGKWSHHCWEGWEGSCVSPKALPSKKQDTVPER